VTHYIANSDISRQRIADTYGRDAAVVHPPVEVERFSPGEPDDYFLFVGQVVGHKRVELALEAAKRAGRRIKIAGDGPDRSRLEAQYGSHAEFLGRVSDVELSDLYKGACALVVPNVEEFGIAAVEVQAAGRPVLGVDAGGLQETVVPGVTGVLVPPDDLDAMTQAMAYVDFHAFSADAIRKNAERFSTDAFTRNLLDEVERVLAIA
jgi:glycosyltransferase involved in cell wall biosynthesis